jgi:hypothetical protein
MRRASAPASTSATWVSWIWPIIIGSDTTAWKPAGRAIRAAFEAAATIDGSSTTIGMKVSMPSTQKFTATANGSAYVPTTFSIMPSATSRGRAPGSTAANTSGLLASPSRESPAASRSRRRRSAMESR